MAVPRTSTSPPKVYLPTPTPLPPGRLFLLLGQNKQYLGRDASLSENQGLPVIKIKATIHLETPSDIAQGKVGKKIGWIEGWNVQLGRVDNEEYSFSSVCRKISPELSTMAKTLFDRTGWFKNELVQPHMAHKPFGDIFHIDTIFLSPPYRGHGISLLAMRYLIDHLPSFRFDIVVLSVKPASPEQPPVPATLNSKSTKALQAVAKKKLFDHWSLLGFAKWSTDRQDMSTGVPFLGLSTRDKQVKASDVVPHWFQHGGLGPDPDASFAAPHEDLEAHQHDNKTAETSEGSHDSPTRKKRHERPIPKLDIAALLEGSLSFADITPVIPPKLFPKGHLSLTINKRKIYMGADAELNAYPIEPLNAKIRYETEIKNDSSAAPIIGKIDCVIIRREHLEENGLTLHDILRHHSKELAAFGKANFDETGRYMPLGPLSEAAIPNRELYDLGDLLLVKDIHLKTRFRGFNLGLLAIWQLVKMLPSYEMDTTYLVYPPSTPQAVKMHFKKVGFGPWGFDRPVAGYRYWGVRDLKPNIRSLVPLAFAQRTPVHGPAVKPPSPEDDLEYEGYGYDDDLGYMFSAELPTEGEVLLELSRQMMRCSCEDHRSMAEGLGHIMREMSEMRSQHAFF